MVIATMIIATMIIATMVIATMVIQMTHGSISSSMPAGMSSGGRGDDEPSKSECQKCLDEAEKNDSKITL